MFDALSEKLQSALGDLRGRGVLDEEAISRAMREVRLALLEADVNFGVVKEFVAQVRERALGEDVRKSLTPGQQVVKIVHEELTELLGSSDSRLAFSQRPPTTILLAGLQGSGKTTAAGKLALLLSNEGQKPALVAADLQRPAAIDQLVQLGEQVGVPVYADERSDPVKAVHDGIERATADGRDVVILDTAGRLHVDEELMEELAAVRREAKPTNVLLVLDAMTGQEAVNVAQAFQERIDFDGVVLTKLDGDARGGAALSVRAVTGRPIKLASLGEKLDALDWFHPDRMASRILGMGDVLTLIERAEAAIEDDEKEELERRMMKGEFTFDDFLSSYKMIRRMGPLQGVLKMIPGLGKQIEGLDEVDEHQLKRVEGIILSMTPHERRVPHVIDASRRKRIAAGSGTTVEQVNQLHRGPKADGEDDEDGRIGQDAADSRNGGGSAYHRRVETASRVRLARRVANGKRRKREGSQMAVKLRLTRVGSKKNPIYRVVAADSRSPRDGKFIEIVGRYNPQSDPSLIDLDEEKVRGWLEKGAQPTESVAKLLKAQGIQ